MFKINDNYIVLNDENDDKIRFEFLDLIEHDSKEYVVLLPVDENDEESYVSVDDKETLMQVFKLLKEKFK